jgi:hypothetical protein
MGNQHSVQVAHASFWYVDPDGAHRWALRGDKIEVGDADFDRGEKAGAFVTSEKEESDLAYDPKTATIEQVLDFVGADRERAVQALDHEQSKGNKARTTLVEKLTAVAEG